MRKKLLITTLLLSTVLMACGKTETVATTEEPTTKENLVVEEKPKEESVSVPFDCEVIIDGESETDYYTLMGVMTDLEQLNAYVTTSLELGDKYPNSAFSYSLESGEQVLVAFNDGELSILANNGDGSGEAQLPSWYEKITDESAESVIDYALSKANKDDWTTVK
jgi:hypothetical protein